LVGKSQGNRSLERPRRRWDDSIRMDMRETVWEVVDWIHLSEDRDHWNAVLNKVMNFQVL
jgi:hypothetical protein